MALPQVATTALTFPCPGFCLSQSDLRGISSTAKWLGGSGGTSAAGRLWQCSVYIPRAGLCLSWSPRQEEGGRGGFFPAKLRRFVLCSEQPEQGLKSRFVSLDAPLEYYPKLCFDYYRVCDLSLPDQGSF